MAVQAQAGRQASEGGDAVTLAELITDLKAAGANENTVRLAMNCWTAGQLDMREKASKLMEDRSAYCNKWGDREGHEVFQIASESIRAIGVQQ